MTLALVLVLFAPPIAVTAAEPDENIEWRAISADDVQGKGWTDTQQPFDRLPARAEAVVRAEVWDLARDSAGMYVDFTTDAPSIWARWTVTRDRLAMYHMPSTGVSGLDLYLQHDGRWHFLANGRAEEKTNTVQLVAEQLHGGGIYRLYLPLYNGISSLEVGVPKGATFSVSNRDDAEVAPVVIYGTSITQGGCASRPGMSYPAIIGRRLNVPVLNLGFSGNGKAEPEVARLLAELNPSAFVLDPLPNLYPSQVAKRLPTFIEILRKRHPSTPIFLVEYPVLPDVPFSTMKAERVTKSNEHLREIYEARVAAGDRNLWLVPACDFTVNGGESTVDGLHPTDVGFLQQADTIEPILRKALATEKQ